MANMSYCRFENTSRDLSDCLDAMREETLEDWKKEASEYEKIGRKRLVELAVRIATEFGDEIGMEVEASDAQEKSSEKTVKKSDVLIVNGEMVAEASSIGFKVGEWPDFIILADEDGDGLLFKKNAPEMHEGTDQLISYLYLAGDGRRLIVMND